MKLPTISLITGMLGCSAANATPLVIVDDSQPRAQIVISSSDTRARLAAEGLQTYIAKMSGAKLEILLEQEALKQPVGIYVGHTQKAKEHDIKIPSGFDPSIREDVFNNEGYVLKIDGNNIFIAGNSEGPYRGTIFGTYAFLERLGCRWYFPGEWGEVVPKKTTIEIQELDVESRPDFPMRFISPGGTYNRLSAEEKQIYDDWAHKIGFTPRSEAEEFYPMVGDGFLGIHLPPENFWESHPEYYAMNENGDRHIATGDVRHWTMLCLSNTNVFNQVRKNLLEAFAGKRDGHRLSNHGFGISPPDGSPYCFCEPCSSKSQKFFYPTYFSSKERTMSEEYYDFAASMARQFPDKWVSTMAYSLREMPPQGVDIPPNIAVMYCPITACALHPNNHPTCWRRQEYTRMLESWRKRTPHIYLYDYNPHFFDGLYVPLCPLNRLAVEVPMYKKMDLRGFNAEGRKAFMQHWISYYVSAKLLWDADSNVEELKKDFYTTFFGPDAGLYVQAWWDACDNALLNANTHSTAVRWISHIYTKEFVDSIRHYVAGAQSSELTNKQRERVDAFVAIAENLSAYAEFQVAAEKMDFKKAAEELENMMLKHEELATMYSFFISPRKMKKHPGFGPKLKQAFEQLDAMTNGDKGELVAPLPIEMRYVRDPFNEGVITEWYAPSLDDTNWDKLNTFFVRNSQVESEDERGHGYTGHAWYRVNFKIPKRFADKPIRFHLGGVQGEVWAWINGQYAGRRDSRSKWSIQRHDMDVTDLVQPGKKNQMTIRVWNQTNIGGLYGRSFFWSPNNDTS